MKCLKWGAFALAMLLTACSGGGPSSPSNPQFSSTSGGGGGVSASAVDPKLKKNVTASISGNTVTGEIRSLYNEDLGQVGMIVFRSDTNPQIFLGEDLQFVSGPVGKVTTFEVVIPDLCGKPLQVDFFLAPRGITGAHRANQFHPSEFIDAEHLVTEGCSPKPEPSPSPTPPPTCDNLSSSIYEECPPEDVCTNLEGLQEEVPEGYYLSEGGECLEECEEEWLEQEPEVTYGEWSECTPVLQSSTGNHNPPPSCSRSRTVITVVNEVNSCTQERREKSRQEGSESEPCECPAPPEPDYCYYNISGSPGFKFAFCLSTGGDWGNWNGQQNHCRYDFPGISSSFAQLTPGQSGNGCLSKHD